MPLVSSWWPPLSDPGYLAYLTVFAAAALGCLAGAWRARHTEDDGVRRGLVGLLGTSGLWALAHVGMLLSPTLGLKITLYKVGLTIGFGTVWAWLWLCSAYSGRALHLRRAAQWAALGVFAATAVTKLTNPWHGLYFSADLGMGPFPHLQIDHHAAYQVTSSLSYVLAGIGFFMLVEPLQRIQVGTGRLAGLFGLTVLPVAANAIGSATPLLLDLNYVSVGVAAFSVGALFVYRTRFEETGRAGREQKPALVMTEGGRLQNYNEAAAGVFPALEKSAIGKRLETTLPEVAEALAGSASVGAESGEEARRKTIQVGQKALRKEEDFSEAVGSDGGPGANAEEVRHFRLVESPFGPGPGRLVVLEDVTEEVLRRQASKRKREETLQRQKSLLEQAHRLAGAWELDLEAGKMSWSEKIYEIHGVEPGTDVTLEEALQFFVPGVRPRVEEALERCAEEGEPYDLELPITTTGGDRRWVRTVGAPAEENDGKITKVAGAFQDITERKRSRRRLERYREYTSQIFDAIDDLFFVLSEAGRVERWNRRFSEVTGYTDEEISQMSAVDLVPEGHRTRVESQIEHVLSTGEGQVEVPLLLKGGSTIPYEFIGDRIENPEGDPQIVVVGRDISERLERERALRQKNDLFERAQRIANVGAWEYDVQEGESLLTSQAYRIHGLSPDGDLTPERSLQFYHSNDRTMVREAFRRAIEDGEPYDVEARLITDRGEERWVRTRGEPQREDGRPEGEVARVRGTIQDITEQKKRERAFRERQEKIGALFEATRHLLTTESRGAVADHIHEALNEVIDFPLIHVELVSEGADVLQTTAPEELSGDPKPESRPVSEDLVATRALRAEEAVVIEDPEALNNNVDNGSFSSLAGIPIGKRGAIVLGQDQAEEFDQFDLHLVEIMARYAALILERLGREKALREAKEEAEEAARLKTAVLANMSHEIRTPLTPVIGFAESLADDLDGSEAQVADRIKRSAQRLQRTLDSVLRLARLEAGTFDLDRKEIDLRAVIREAADRVGPAAEEGLALEMDLPDHPVRGRVSESGVRRIVENLLENAVKFTPEGGRVEVRLRDGPEGRPGNGADQSPEEVVLEVEDTGIGIHEEAQANIFEAFEQESDGLGREYEGTGLGLSVVKRLTKTHGGSVEVESEKGKGSRFIVRLPRE